VPKFYGKTIFPDYKYETSGNYVYSFSVREAQKIAQGLNLPQIIYKGFNTHYIEGCEFEPADVEKSPIFKEIVDTIASQDSKCEKGLLSYSGIMLGILKEKLDLKTRSNFEKKGWSIVDLPRNPYLK
jgi:hypothetical protein